jgi:peptidoglycan hydrolase-like protein with peptidoglycan-binding domain
MPPRNASVPELKTQTMDRILAAGEPARRLASGETTVTRMIARGLLRKPMRSLGWIMGAGVAFAIFGNILLMQPERHKAPMFVGNPQIHTTPQATLVPLPPQRPTSIERDSETLRRNELLRDIQLELGRRGFYAGEPDPTAMGRTNRAIRDFQAAAGLPVNGEASDVLLASIMTSTLRPRDQIANLLRNAPVDRLERPETVVAIQRALTRLGYGPLSDDGHFGPGTRAALDKFEKDRKLPGRGNNPTRVIRELAQISGIAID